MTSRKRLGRGLDALLGGRADEPSGSKAGSDDRSTYRRLELDALTRGKYQPRISVADDELRDLTNSIREQGVLQPLVVRKVTKSSGASSVTHEIVAGERRWRAARLAGLKTVPVVVYELDDQAALAVALIENLQREDLNAIEIAESLLRLTREFGLTHQAAADAVGRSRSSVSNLIRLLELEAGVKDLLAAGHMEMGHARALLPLDADRQKQVAMKIVADRMSVRRAEQTVTKLLDAEAENAQPQQSVIDMQTRWLQQQLANEAGLKVGLRSRKDGNHKLEVGFQDLEQLQAALQKIESLLGQVIETAGPRVRDRNG